METVDSFIQKIEADLGWRKKEVSNLILLETPQNQQLIIKATLLLLYSHWEGYIKNISKLYLEYISTKRIVVDKLTDNFKAISLKGLIQEVYKSSSTLTLANELNFIHKVGSNTEKRFILTKGFTSSDKDKTIVNTKDNLSLDVFKSIVRIVGLDYSDSMDTKAIFIDEKLLGTRNKVAHGNRIEDFDSEFDFTIEDLKILKEVIFFLMEVYSEDLKYFAEKELYYSSNSKVAVEYLSRKTEFIRQYMP